MAKYMASICSAVYLPVNIAWRYSAKALREGAPLGGFLRRGDLALHGLPSPHVDCHFFRPLVRIIYDLSEEYNRIVAIFRKISYPDRMAGEVNGWLTIPAAAERFGLKRDRLQKAASQGRLAATKLGAGKSHAWLVKAEDVERFARESRRGPKPGTKKTEAAPPVAAPRARRSMASTAR